MRMSTQCLDVSMPKNSRPMPRWSAGWRRSDEPTVLDGMAGKGRNTYCLWGASCHLERDIVFKVILSRYCPIPLPYKLRRISSMSWDRFRAVLACTSPTSSRTPLGSASRRNHRKIASYIFDLLSIYILRRSCIRNHNLRWEVAQLQVQKIPTSFSFTYSSLWASNYRTWMVKSFKYHCPFNTYYPSSCHKNTEK